MSFCNFSHYKKDIIPYDFSIPKKEIDDIIHDGEIYCSNEDFLNNSMLSIGSRKRQCVTKFNNLDLEDHSNFNGVGVGVGVKINQPEGVSRFPSFLRSLRLLFILVDSFLEKRQVTLFPNLNFTN